MDPCNQRPSITLWMSATSTKGLQRTPAGLLQGQGLAGQTAATCAVHAHPICVQQHQGQQEMMMICYCPADTLAAHAFDIHTFYQNI
jgi:hypothetical protein